MSWYKNRAKAFEPTLALIADGIFTVTSVLVHVVAYTIFILAEGPPLTIFLNTISIEAVMVSLCVGIRTKLNDRAIQAAQTDRDELQRTIDAHIENDERLTGEIHTLVHEVHARVTEGRDHR